MNREDILRLAREVWGDDSNKPWHESALVHLERFAALVAAAEREACADMVLALTCEGTPKDCFEVAACYIRARGQN